MICKHFNLSLRYVDEDMLVTDWFCALSVAVDAEEDGGYNLQFAAYVAGGYDPKKFPRRPRRTVAEAGEKPDILGALRKAGVPIGQRRGNFEEYARVRNLKKVFQLEDGTFVDEEGHRVVPPPGSVYVPTKKKGG